MHSSNIIAPIGSGEALGAAAVADVVTANPARAAPEPITERRSSILNPLMSESCTIVFSLVSDPKLRFGSFEIRPSANFESDS